MPAASAELWDSNAPLLPLSHEPRPPPVCERERPSPQIGQSAGHQDSVWRVQAPWNDVAPHAAAFESQSATGRGHVASSGSSLLPRQLGRMMSGTLNLMAATTTADRGSAGDDSSVDSASGGLAETRLEDLLAEGYSRRDALRRLARENMDAEVREGLVETLAAGTYPGLVGVFMCLGTLSCCFVVAAFLVCICCCAMNLAGILLTCIYLRCDGQQTLRHWLVLLQVSVLLEGCCVSVVNVCYRHCLAGCVASIDARARPGFTRAVLDLCLVSLSSAWKVAWCLHTQALVAAEASSQLAEGSCASSLPRFMSIYSQVLMMQVLLVQPIARILMRVMSWAAASGALSTTRGAKPGTLEALALVDYEPALLADPDDPGAYRQNTMRAPHAPGMLGSLAAGQPLLPHLPQRPGAGATASTRSESSRALIHSLVSSD
ncbi:unnamed protein product [Polarella glacialis]|uniref:Uncharacterized protein n=1 Tax=Polarella glacialis TaxID=89957 RepID=A0A813L1E7_POLGL|nr:unnamed protein product [Polarella glacialis]CAE8719664.1 unnamed protein product [Polarella glacialis]